MAQTIHKLPPTLANKIAAGEVVQRPASVVKELMENAIDAGAKSITVIIKEGGKTLVRVIDDGSGMDHEDAEVAFERHATSKITTYEDLENITTLGFRGEALASIAAVSQVEMKTRRRESDVGTKVRIDGGVLTEVVPEAAPPGTSIAVNNLFYNTPARRNFLKAGTTEFKHIADVIQRMAISHPDVAITFISEGETIFQLQPESHEKRLAAVFGDKLTGSLICIDETSQVGRLRAFLGRPEFARKGKTDQYLFLNNRTIISRNLGHAVFQAYEHLLEKGTFPIYVILLEVDPVKVDVNVHPSKMEVKFEDEGSVYRFILMSLRKALSGHDLIPQAAIGEEQGTAGRLSLHTPEKRQPIEERPGNWQDLIRREEHAPVTPSSPEQKPELAFPSSTRFSSSYAERSESQPGDSVSPMAEKQLPLWQLHNKYLIVPTDTGVMIIDQHAAHERVLYERAVVRFNGMPPLSQQLLFPHTLQMAPGDAALVKELHPWLEKLGFSLNFFSQNTIIVDGVPADIRPGQEGSILQNIIDLYKEDEQGVKIEPRERLAKSYSCKAAIKAGDPLSGPEMRGLLDQLFATEIPYVCPHGRPVMIKLSLGELDKRFGRTS